MPTAMDWELLMALEELVEELTEALVPDFLLGHIVAERKHLVMHSGKE